MRRGEIHFADFNSDPETASNDITKIRPVIILGNSGPPRYRYTVLPLTSQVGKAKKYEVNLSLEDMGNSVKLDKPSKALIYHLRTVDSKLIYNECIGIVSAVKMHQIDDVLASYLALDFEGIGAVYQATISSLQNQLVNLNAHYESELSSQKARYESRLNGIARYVDQIERQTQESHQGEVRNHRLALRRQKEEIEDLMSTNRYLKWTLALGVAAYAYKSGFFSKAPQTATNASKIQTSTFTCTLL